MAADVTWALADVAGNILDTDGTTVGTTDGAGTISISAATIVHVGDSAGSGSYTLTIEDGITVKFGAGSRLQLYAHAGSSTYGTLKIEGAGTGVVLTSDAGTPAAGDWVGISHAGNTEAATVAGLYQRLEMSSTTIEYASTCVQSHASIGHVACKVTAWNCVFRYWSTSALDNQGGYGFDSVGTILPQAWRFTGCQLVNDVDSPGAFPVSVATAGAPTADERAYIVFEHCSFFVQTDNASNETVFRIAADSGIKARNCVTKATNDGAGSMYYVYMSGTGLSAPFDYNFWLTNGVTHPSGVAFSEGAGSQIGNPDYLDEAARPYDLSPDAQAGDPDLYLADEFNWYPGAVEPYNYPTPGPGEHPIDPEGTTGVWAGRKQRVYECTFGEDADKTLGRAIRVGVSSSDGVGTKLIGGIFLKINPERLK